MSASAFSLAFAGASHKLVLVRADTNRNPVSLFAPTSKETHTANCREQYHQDHVDSCIRYTKPAAKRLPECLPRQEMHARARPLPTTTPTPAGLPGSVGIISLAAIQWGCHPT